MGFDEHETHMIFRFCLLHPKFFVPSSSSSLRPGHASSTSSSFRIAGCHGEVLLLGIKVGCDCWMPLLGAMAVLYPAKTVPLHTTPWALILHPGARQTGRNLGA